LDLTQIRKGEYQSPETDAELFSKTINNKHVTGCVRIGKMASTDREMWGLLWGLQALCLEILQGLLERGIKVPVPGLRERQECGFLWSM
jgi:hypothetical protein